MAPKTVQQLFGLKEPELNALATLSGLEGFRGGQNSPDVAAVAANLLARRMHGGWGGIDIRNIATAPGQFEAVKNYNMQQLSDPAFGARVLGSPEEFNRLRAIVNDPFLVGEQFKRSKGAMSFRGTAAYQNRKPGDYMPVPGQSNFYFDPIDQQRYQQGLRLFGSAGQPSSSPMAPPSAPPAVSSILGPLLGTDLSGSQKKKGLAQQFVQGVLSNLIPGGIFGVFNR